MTPPTVNAYYNPSMNDINFPAGILQPPFFDFTIDPAVNFGGIGVVIGHEMTHGFDDEGSKYDGKGNLREWQTADDRKAFTERTDCEADEYSGFEAAPAHGDVAAAEAERQAHPGREHGRQRRPAHRLHGAAGHAGRAGQDPSTTRSTATPRRSATSSALRRCGARTRPSSRRGSRR